MPGLNKLPPFPEDVPTHPLLIIDYQLLKEGNEDEINRLWDAATKLGFWYLKNHGADKEVDGMFEMGAETMGLSLEEKMKFEQGDEGASFGYKAAGASAVDEQGTLDTVELINVAKDDALAWPNKVHRDYPSTVNARMENTIKPFVQKSVEVNGLIIDILNDKLSLPKGTLASKHRLLESSGSEARAIKNPPRPGGVDDAKTALGAHTDFGSLAFLHNRLGGLQVMPPGSHSWYYVKPLPGHAICNIGDALAVFSGGILRSNVHRIVTAPKEQAKYERWSTAFFTRPADYVELTALTDESPMIAEAVNKLQDPNRYCTGQTSAEWFARRNKYKRIKNRSCTLSREHRASASYTNSVPLKSIDHVSYTIRPRERISHESVLDKTFDNDGGFVGDQVSMPGLDKAPPFPEDLPIHPLLVIDYQLLKEDDADEINRLWEAATKLGFWYLKNHGTDKEVDEMFEMGAETMDLSLNEKMKFDIGSEGASYGYKALGADALDQTGAPDTNEMIDVSKDDALAWPNKAHREYPFTVNARMESTIKPFVQKSVEINGLIIDILNDKLGLPKGALAEKHKMYEPSGSLARVIRSPPQPGGIDDAKMSMASHTDFGSLWRYLAVKLASRSVRICRFASQVDTDFTSPARRTPPKEQAKHERWSLGFFTRPANHTELTALVDESPMIAEAVKTAPDPNTFCTGQTSGEWHSRRVKYQRSKHITGPEAWRAGRGTEHYETDKGVAV
ncbi:hypothetical protein NM688_g3981 [Phlebia brevispora]|uniref:Uncharacterized protein n=1 Tax=Phlebia brevispora TaxID=194682 RepID=A0ACC1T4E4_9APHY|nr:hypothetical protein NM688_g3981 [Phlebia brevispora]